jgi:hypothetical protein
MPSDQDISTITAIPNEGQLTIQEAFKRAADYLFGNGHLRQYLYKEIHWFSALLINL